MSEKVVTRRTPRQERVLLDKLGLIPEEDFAALLRVSVKTLKNRPLSDLPAFVKAGRRRLFKEASVRDYLERHTISAT